MYLSKFRIGNYKSFRDSGEIEFKSGINIIVGQNNSGKTALLEALVIGDVGSKAHKSSENLVAQYLWQNNETRDELKAKEAPKVKATIFIPPNELRDFDMKVVKVPFNQDFNKEAPLDLMISSTQNNLESFNSIFQIGLFVVFKSNGNGVNSEGIEYSFNETLETDILAKYKDFFLYKNENTYDFDHTKKPPTIADLGKLLGMHFCSSIYKFQAERLFDDYCLLTHNTELKSDASNLAEVINLLDSNEKDLYEELNSLVSVVIPSIKTVSVKKVQNDGRSPGEFGKIIVWTSDKKTRKTENNFYLEDCGTGVGQVLAILYVIVTSKEKPRTIIIDEPNSFLHPTASKALINIFKENDQHQYFISTHSPEIVTTTNASTITMLKYVDGETKAEQLDLGTGNDKLKLVEELGMEMSDFFFAENVLWVEGPTEAKAFPLIIRESECLVNFVAVPLVSTDDLKDRKRGRKHAKTNIENIRRLSGEYALTPPNIFIVLDREETTNQELTDLEKIGIKFIPRRMYENYLLDANAIAEILNGEILEKVNYVNPEQVQTILDSSLAAYPNEAEWLERVDSAKLLDEIFTELSDRKVEYRKTTHSIELTKWLLRHKEDQLIEIREFLVAVLTKQPTII